MSFYSDVMYNNFIHIFINGYLCFSFCISVAPISKVNTQRHQLNIMHNKEHTFIYGRFELKRVTRQSERVTPNDGTTNEYANIVTHTHENQNQMSSDVTSDEKKKKGIIIKN